MCSRCVYTAIKFSHNIAIACVIVLIRQMAIRLPHTLCNDHRSTVSDKPTQTKKGMLFAMHSLYAKWGIAGQPARRDK